MSDYMQDLHALRMAMGGAVRRYDVGGPVSAPSNPVFVPGLGMIDPMTGAPMPNYMGSMANPQAVAAGQSPPSQTGVGQTWMPQPQGATSQPQMAPQSTPQQEVPYDPNKQYWENAAAQPTPVQRPAASGSTLTSALSNPIVGALLGAGLGAVGGGRNGAISGAIGGPMLGNNMANAITAGNAQDPNTSLAALSARYLPLLAASYAGSMYRNPTAPQYGKPASQSAALETPTPTGAPKPKPGSWYTYGQVPDYTLTPSGQAKGGMQRGTGMSSLGSASVAAGQSGQHFVPGDDSGVADTVDAKLSSGEYVVPAHVVSALGDGSSQAGAKTLDRLQDNVRLRQGKQMAKDKHPRKMPPPEKVMDEDFEP